MDVVKEDMKLVGMKREDAEDGVRRRRMIRRGNSRKEKKTESTTESRKTLVNQGFMSLFRPDLEAPTSFFKMHLCLDNQKGPTSGRK